jgi:hypothetical protein
MVQKEEIAPEIAQKIAGVDGLLYSRSKGFIHFDINLKLYPYRN